MTIPFHHTMSRSITFKANYWFFEEENDEILIHIGGMTNENKSVYVIAEGFTPFVYLELPDLRGNQKWTKQRITNTFEYFKKTMGKKGPVSYMIDKKYSLYGKKPMNVMYLNFTSQFHARYLATKCMRGRHYIPGVGNFQPGELKVHEHNIDVLVKYTAIQNINLAGWLTVKEYLSEEDKEYSEDERRFTTCDIDLYTKWSDVIAAEGDYENVVLEPKYCSFDIETYSENHNSKLPNPDIKANEIFQIAAVFGKLRSKEKKKKYLLSLYNPHDIKGVKVQRFQNEKELLLDFRDLIVSENPDLMIGYNIMKFDWGYIAKRAEVNGIAKQMALMGRLEGTPAEVKEFRWNSSAYGDQNINYYNLHGRLNIDILLEVERSYRLPKYSLNYVANKFLGKGKDPVTPRQMFMIVKLSQIVQRLNETNHFIPSKETLKELKSIAKKILIVHMFEGETLTWRAKLLKSNPNTFYDILRDGITLIGKYCVKDTVLPVELESTLNLFTTMEETSNVVHVPMDYIHNRGQQIKVLAQIYRETLKNNIVIPFVPRGKGKDEDYQGAIVIEANPGDYNNVVTEDFASLYPNTMRSFNICYTTLRSEEDKNPANDHLYHKINWIEHKNCQHDPNKKGGAKKKVLCGEYCYYWKKPVYSVDENGNVQVEGIGLVPKLLGRLLAARSKAKKEMAYHEARLKMHRGKATKEDLSYYRNRCKWEIVEPGSLSDEEEYLTSIKFGVSNAKQLALKVSANSVYGITGARKGYIPLIPAAASITAMGRDFIIKAIKEILRKWPQTKLVYGDSVTPDTPLLVRTESGSIKYITIDDLSDRWKKMLDKETSHTIEPLEVWSDKGWTQIVKVVRHKTNKKIYRVTTHTGSVDVTEDHSLLLEDGSEISPKDVKIGDKLLQSDLPVLQIDSNLSVEEAFVWGFFYAYGSCDISGTKYSWVINNQNLDYLEQTLSYLAICEPEDEFRILDTMDSNSVYKLVPKGDNKRIVTKYRPLFYDKHKYKIVPGSILNSPQHIKDAFMEGYYIGDGDKDMRQTICRFDSKGKIGSAGLYYINQCSRKVSVNTREDKPKIYRLTVCDNQRKTPNVIKKIEDLGPSEDYVYDIETENHHFCAGVGNIVVHNTDSCMLKFEGCDVAESWKLGEITSAHATHFLKCYAIGIPEDTTVIAGGKKYRLDKISSNHEDYHTMNDNDKIILAQYEDNPTDLEFENLYKRFVLLTKKRYAAYACNKDGEIIGKTKKGIVLTRRDNCEALRDYYERILDEIMEELPEDQIMNVVYEGVRQLFTRQVPDSKLLIYMGVKNAIEYAEKIEIKNKEGRVISTPFIDSNGDPIDNVEGWDDPRLVYRNIPQCLLCLKMLKRGEEIPPNTRLEFLYIRNKEAAHQGDKAEEYSYYKDNKVLENLKPDYLHYLEKQFCKPVAELLRVKFSNEIIVYRDPKEEFLRLVRDIENEVTRKRILSTMKFIKNRPFIDLGITDEKKRVYNYKGMLAQVVYILESTKKKGPFEVDPRKHLDLIEMCKKIHARYIIDKTHSHYGLVIRKTIKPSNTGKKLPKRGKIQISFLVNYKDKSTGEIIPQGTLGTKIDRIEEGDDEFSYVIFIEGLNGMILEGVPRHVFSPYHIRDSKIMSDLFEYRKVYADVVDHLDEIFEDTQEYRLVFD